MLAARTPLARTVLALLVLLGVAWDAAGLCLCPCGSRRPEGSHAHCGAAPQAEATEGALVPSPSANRDCCGAAHVSGVPVTREDHPAGSAPAQAARAAPEPPPRITLSVGQPAPALEDHSPPSLIALRI